MGLFPAGFVLVHKSVMPAVHAFFEKGQDQQSDPGGADTDSPQHRSPADLFTAALAYATPDAAFLTVHIQPLLVLPCHFDTTSFI
jgi:hypothetical protein